MSLKFKPDIIRDAKKNISDFTKDVSYNSSSAYRQKVKEIQKNNLPENYTKSLTTEEIDRASTIGIVCGALILMAIIIFGALWFLDVIRW